MRNFKEEYRRWLDSPALTEEEWSKVTNVVKTKDGGAPASLVAEARRKILSEAKYSPGHPGNHTLGFTLKKN